MRYATIALMMTLCLSGCGPEVSKKSKILVLPDIVVYPAALQKQAAHEIEGRACPVLVEFGKDYSVMRDQTRAAQKGLK